MGMRPRRQDRVAPGAPVAPAARAARGGSVARTLRTAWWPRFMVAGLILIVVGGTLLADPAQALVTLAGALVFVFAAGHGGQGRFWEQDSRREPPVPPGSGGQFS